MTFDEMQLLLQQIAITQRELAQNIDRIVLSNDRTIQAMLDQAATARLKQEEDRIRHEQRMEKLERISEGLINLFGSIDEDRPTILRKLNAIEDKTDAIINRLNRQ
jgi:hypothetical protein